MAWVEWSWGQKGLDWCTECDSWSKSGVWKLKRLHMVLNGPVGQGSR